MVVRGVAEVWPRMSTHALFNGQVLDALSRPQLGCSLADERHLFGDVGDVTASAAVAQQVVDAVVSTCNKLRHPSASNLPKTSWVPMKTWPTHPPDFPGNPRVVGERDIG